MRTAEADSDGKNLKLKFFNLVFVDGDLVATHLASFLHWQVVLCLLSSKKDWEGGCRESVKRSGS